jgi:hypothetical protein
MWVVRWGSKTPVAVLVALLLVAGLGGCGGGSGSSTSSEATTATAEGGVSGEAESAKATGGGGGAEGKSEKAEAARSFKPKRHHDSGGGAAQYRVKGGDNSIQEFGTEAEGPEFAKAAAALHGFLDARAQGAWAAACSYLSKSTVESFEQLAAQSKQGDEKSCADILGQLINPATKQLMKEEAAEANVGSLRTEGERAFLIYTGAEKTVIAVPMTREGDVWKVASIAGTPIS